MLTTLPIIGGMRYEVVRKALRKRYEAQIPREYGDDNIFVLLIGATKPSYWVNANGDCSPSIVKSFVILSPKRVTLFLNKIGKCSMPASPGQALRRMPGLKRNQSTPNLLRWNSLTQICERRYPKAFSFLIDSLRVKRLAAATPSVPYVRSSHRRIARHHLPQ